MINLYFFRIFVVSYLLKMFRKIFILAFLSVSFTVWATPCSTVFPQLQISDSVMKCRLDTLRFEPQASLMYLWSDSSTNPYFVVRSTEIIWVEISDSAGNNTCRDTIHIYLFPIPEISFDFFDTIACFDFNLGGFELNPTFDIAHSDASQYDWIWNNQNRGNENTFIVPYENQGMQFVEVQHRFCYGRGLEEYSAKDSVDVRFWDKRWTNAYRLISDTLVCNRGIRVSLNATAEIENLTTYEWSGPGITDTLNPIQIVYVGNFTGTGNFTVILRDSAGCEREFPIEVRTEICDPSLEMPNVFTPNNDGVNDFFMPTVFHRVYNFHLRIYNRAGRMVYEFEVRGDFPSEQEWPGWNGRIGGTGSEAPEGVYFWAVRYDDIWGRRHREQGTVTLLR